MIIITNGYNDLCIQDSGLNDLDQRYIFDTNEKLYGKFGLMWKGMKDAQYWFWLYYNKNTSQYEWTIDDIDQEVLRYCALPENQQKSIRDNETSYLSPFACEKWFSWNETSQEEKLLEAMEVVDCDMYTVDITLIR